MKTCLTICALLLLAACIGVDDIGDYWAKGIVDSAIAGTWKEDKQDSPEIRSVTLKTDEYQIDALDEKSKSAKDYKPILARTLNVGSYTYFMTDPAMNDAKAEHAKRSDIWRYKLKGDTLTLYILQPAAMSGFLRKYREKYPRLSISVDGYGDKNGDRRFVAIQKLDEGVFRILAQVPDNDKFWVVAKKYVRQTP